MECRLLTKKPYHHGDLRAQLINGAVEVIREQGVEALSLRALARRLGVSHAAPARHFANKDALLNAIITDGSATLMAMATSVFSQRDQAPRKRLKAFAMAFMHWVKDNPAYNSVMRSPEVTRFADQSVMERLKELMVLIDAAVREAQAKGWRRDEDTAILVSELVLTILGAITVLSEPIYGAVRASLADPAIFETIVDSILADRLSESVTTGRSKAVLEAPQE